MAKSKLRRMIDEIPHGDGWWHDSNADTYEGLAQRLVRAGVAVDEAVDVLASAFHAAADEFGS